MNLTDTDFQIFDLPARYAQDPSQLDARWKALQREVHPDKFAAQGAAAQRVAMQWAVRVNEAYQRLKDPVKRAAYLCERRGVPIQAERNTAMPVEFLQQQLAWREALDEAAQPAAVQALQAEVAEHERTLMARLQHQLDAAGDTPAAAQQLRALMFVARFRHEIEDRLEAVER